MSVNGDDASASQVQGELTQVFTHVLNYLKGEIGVEDVSGRPQYTDVCEWMCQLLHSKEMRDAYCTSLAGLLAECVQICQVDPGEHQDKVPATLQQENRLRAFPLRLWQLGIHEASHVKGAPPLHSVRDCMQKFIAGYGNETIKYPLEVLFNWTSPFSPADLQPDTDIPNFSIALAIGSSVTMACHLLCIGVMKTGILNADSLSPTGRKELAHRLVKCLCSLAAIAYYLNCLTLLLVAHLLFIPGLHGTCSPKGSIESQSMEALRVKTDAASRVRPTIYNMHYLRLCLICCSGT